MTKIRMQLLHMLRLLWPSQQRGYVLVITSCTACSRHKYSQAPPTSRTKPACALPIFCTVEPVTLKQPWSFYDWFFVDFSQNFSERAPLVLKNSITISILKIGIVEPVTKWKRSCLFYADFTHDLYHDFLHNGTPFLTLGPVTNTVDILI